MCNVFIISFSFIQMLSQIILYSRSVFVSLIFKILSKFCAVSIVSNCSSESKLVDLKTWHCVEEMTRFVSFSWQNVVAVGLRDDCKFDRRHLDLGLLVHVLGPGRAKTSILSIIIFRSSILNPKLCFRTRWVSFDRDVAVIKKCCILLM